MTSAFPPVAPVDLPKGIVENTAEIYAAVAQQPFLARDEILALWRIYTTTHRSLVDPTARRLENFWWHVWNNPRRFTGQQLANLFKHISDGPTVVRLLGPPNRYEGPPKPRSSQHEGDRPGAPHRGVTSEQAQPFPSGHDRVSSSSRPPPKHSILKKPRGPSSSGPRPTARFVMPHDSDEEAIKVAEGPSSGSTTTIAAERRPTSTPAPDRRTPYSGTKKFVVNSSASKRRPALARRPSSQSSTGSDMHVGSREAISPSAPKLPGSSRSVVTVVEQDSRPPMPASRGSLDSPARPKQSQMSAKAAGKRPATRTLSESPANPPQNTLTSQPQPQPLVVQARNDLPFSEENGRQRHESKVSHEVESRVRQAGIRTAAPNIAQASRSRQSRDRSGGRPLPQALIASSVTATSTVAVQGTFDSDHPQLLPSITSVDDQNSSRDIAPSLASRKSASSLYESRFTPTQPSSTPPVPFGRSKSQLTLLLERDKERVGDAKSKSASENSDDEKRR